MNKMKRVLALLAVVLLIGLYLCTFVFSLFDSELSQNLFMASVALTIILPVLFYGMMMFYRLFHKDDE